MKHLMSVLFVLVPFFSCSQQGVIKGRVYDEFSNEPIIGATVVLEGTTTGAVTDIEGIYVIDKLEPGLYNIEVSFIGYEKRRIFEIQVFNSKVSNYDIALRQSSETLDEIVITSEVFKTREESPVSLRTIGVAEIERNPGGNRDISKVIQSLPGVASTPNFRNDIIIRGGAPNENRFFLDGIEVPTINHFSTQGSSGGPVGLINVNFIKEVDLYTGAFPANRGNALSSVMELTQKDANTEKTNLNFTLGSSDAGLTIDTPLGSKSGLILSVRRSYLQFLFEALDLPFLPTYNDVQAKYKLKINKKNELTVLGLGAIDEFELNPGSIEGIDDPEILERNLYALGNIPDNSQWSYTTGLSFKHFGTSSFQTIVLSRNHLNNEAIKYENNSGLEEDLNLHYTSEEIENKFRFESTHRKNNWKWNYGVNAESANYLTSTFRRDVAFDGSVFEVVFDSDIKLMKYGFFGQVSRAFKDNTIQTSFGLRTDASDYSDEMDNPLGQLSPRFSMSYKFAPSWSFNFNLGRFYQLPAYTVLGYRDFSGELVNRTNGVKYIQSDHFVAGFRKEFPNNTQVSLEGFYKKYDDYPFVVRDSVSLANLGADFGVVGNDEVTPDSEGRAYGLELLLQRKLKKGIYGILAVTFVRSEFTNKEGEFAPAAWDNRYIVTFTGGKKFKKNWELGMKWRFFGGAPYTPWDLQRSSLISVWNATGQGVLNHDLTNTERIQSINQMDLRLDKRYYFSKWTLDVYLDIENVYNYEFEDVPYVDVIRDENDQAMIDPDDPNRYLLKEVANPAGTVLPSIGIVIEF
ncbi:MAG: TonB-dependent receptor [Flavobacteriales bacterium]|nr:TonB-dependent receptor [Flavobacteriales bacterium]